MSDRPRTAPTTTAGARDNSNGNRSGRTSPIPTLNDAMGSDEFKIEASVRARYETYDNPFRAGDAASADLLNFRTLITAEYDAGPIAIGGTSTR